ncbi:MAG TPA: glycosyltransferase [Candidatus Saccharimonadales bacterium]
MVKKTVLALFPPATPRGRLIKRIAVKLHLAKPFAYDAKYQLWMDNAEEQLFLHPIEHTPKKQPLFSIIVPMYNTQDKYLQPLVYSVINQSFKDWELILADGSTDPERQAAIKHLAASDERIVYFALKENKGISENTNAGLERAKGEYVVFSDHDDVLSPHALNELAAAIKDKPATEILYSDEDKITDDGVWRHWPHFKPDWSPHQFLSCNYTNHVSAVKRELANKVKGLRTECNGAQDYDFLMRIHALPGKRVVTHIPKVLYYWRTAEGSTAGDFTVKEYALKAGEKAVQTYLDSQGVTATVKSLEGRPGFYDPNIAPAKNREALVIVGNDQTNRMAKTLYEKIESMTNVDAFKHVTFVTGEEFAKRQKHYLDSLDGADVVVRILANTVPNQEDWLARLTGALELDDTFAVAPRIIAYDGRIWDMGAVIDAEGAAVPLFKGLLAHDDSPYGHTEWIRDVDTLSGDFYAIRKKDFAWDQTVVESKRAQEYVAIWSVVEATYYGSLQPKTKQFNENLNVGRNGHMTTLWLKK